MILRCQSLLRTALAPILYSLCLSSALAGSSTAQTSAASPAVENPFRKGAVSVEALRERAKTHPHVKGELVVALRTVGTVADAANALRGMAWSERTGRENAALVRPLFAFQDTPGDSITLALVDVGPGGVLRAMRALENDPEVLWSSPNFISTLADPREIVPNDPQYASQYHHPLMQNDLAWDFTFGSSSIVIGVTDDGVDVDHVDLISNVWIHPGEVAGDGIDNDANGYIDDVSGWDFVFDNNDANPNSAGDDHGTHVGGIAAADTDNGVGVAGTAGGCTLLPLQFFSSGQPWTAANIAETFAYSVDNGAQITTTSYNIDGWVGDPVFTAGLQYLYDQGGLHFNSAGNGSAFEPPRQAFEQTLLVANTNASDVISSTSNRGTGIDFAAPGSSIRSTVLNDAYANFSGTSMAAPNAAGVAALIWSQNPSWTREQVVAQMMATADNIDGANPGLEGLLGAGRVNSYRALTEAVGAPTIMAMDGLPPNGATTQSTSLSTFELTFDQLMDPASVNAASNYELRWSGTDGTFETADDALLSVTPAKTYQLGTNDMQYDVTGGSLELGDYRLTVFAGGLQNPFGSALDGDGDSLAGGDFVSFFTVGPEQVQPAGSLIHELARADSIDTVSEVDTYGLNIDAGQNLSVRVSGQGSLLPALDVRDPFGTLVASGSAVGSSVLVQALPITTAGNYQIDVTGTAGTTGSYDLALLLNSIFEEEPLGAVANDAPAMAEDLDLSSVGLATGTATRLAAVGQTGITEDFESETLSSAWALSSSAPEGRIQITDAFGAANGSDFALLMDSTVDGVFSRNEAIWTVDLSGITAPVLNFHHAEWSDELTTLPLTFTGSFDGDGVSISDDGTNWYRVLAPVSSPSGVWNAESIDLTAAAASAGMTLGPNFRIKFQQYDNFSLTTDGRGYDEISISSASGFSDWYRFSLSDGEDATVAVLASAAGATATVDLFAGDGTTLLGSGSPAANLSSVLPRYIDATSDGGADTYYAQVNCSEGEYALLVTRSATFDIENNNSQGSSQNLLGFDTLLGHVDAGADDYYAIGVPSIQRLLVSAELPASGPYSFGNGLITDGMSALRMELLAPGGGVVASGSSSVLLASAQPGVYLLRVFATGKASGEYVLSVERRGATYVDVSPQERP